jgi:hypothetical protein
MEETGHTEDTPAPARSHRVAVYSLLIAGTVCTFLAIAAIWINRQVMETDNWVNTSTKLLEDKEIRAALSTYMVDQLYANVDVAGEIRSALPPRAAPLAGPAAGAVRNLAEQGANEALQRPRVQALWKTSNRVAHEQFIRVVKGGGNNVSTDNGVVTLNLGNILQAFANQTGVGGRVASKIGPDSAKIVILKSDQLKTGQDIANLLRPLALVLTLLGLALFGGAIALAGDRKRQAFRSAGYAFIIAGLLALVLRSVGGGVVVDSLAKTESIRPAIEHTWTIGTSILVEVATAAIIYGVVAVIAAWLAGPTRAAIATRRALAPILADPIYAWGGLTVLVALVVWWGPTPATRRLVPGLILLALVITGMVVLRRQTAREFPDAEMQEIGPALRGWWERARSHAPARGGSAATPAAAHGGNGGASLSDLERLSNLHDKGALTDEEFAAQKRQLLAAG